MEADGEPWSKVGTLGGAADGGACESCDPSDGTVDFAVTKELRGEEVERIGKRLISVTGSGLLVSPSGSSWKGLN